MTEKHKENKKQLIMSRLANRKNSLSNKVIRISMDGHIKTILLNSSYSNLKSRMQRTPKTNNRKLNMNLGNRTESQKIHQSTIIFKITFKNKTNKIQSKSFHLRKSSNKMIMGSSRRNKQS